MLAGVVVVKTVEEWRQVMPARTASTAYMLTVLFAKAI